MEISEPLAAGNFECLSASFAKEGVTQKSRSSLHSSRVNPITTSLLVTASRSMLYAARLRSRAFPPEFLSP